MRSTTLPIREAWQQRRSRHRAAFRGRHERPQVRLANDHLVATRGTAGSAAVKMHGVVIARFIFLVLFCCSMNYDGVRGSRHLSLGFVLF